MLIIILLDGSVSEAKILDFLDARILPPLQVGNELHKKERLFDNAFYDIIESVEKVNY